ncbi:MAG TPA: maleylpyruvate isomerase family mycothiol-dependent enzyme [Ardenticatenaceae bacterium]|jgi:uncharacterized protein (TIGR03083 family)
MKPPEPILVTDLFPEILDELLVLLASLTPEEWESPTVAEGWSVRDVALHLLGGDVGILSRQRDGYAPPGPPIASWDELVAFINHLNDTWLQAARRISPRLLVALLRFTGEQVSDHFRSRDPHALGGAVSWAGPEPAPVWLDLAREYTERWHHQQHIRAAVGKPGLTEPRYLAPVLDAFVRALPHTFRNVPAGDGTLVALTITGDAGGRWFLLRQKDKWTLYLDVAQPPDAETILPQEVAWRLFTKGISKSEAQAEAILIGDSSLALKLLDTVSIIA